MKKIAIILAAGSGQRLEENQPKCLVKINNKPIYEYSLDTFMGTKIFDLIILVMPKSVKLDNTQLFSDLIIINGGKTRNESFEKAMTCIEDIVSENDLIVVHDAARIFVKEQDIIRLVNCKEPFASLCYEASDTIYGGNNINLLPKPNYCLQTPQMFKYKVYLGATKNIQGTDLFSYLSLKPSKKSLILSSNKMYNIKMTYPIDLEVANILLKDK